MTESPPATQVTLHPLAMREDHGEWLVGRPETGVCVALPDDGVTVLRLLEQGLTVPETAARLPGLAVDAFLHDLVDLGFVAALDGRPVPQPDPPRPTFPRLRPAHVRWTLSPLLPVLLGLLLAVAAGLLVARPELLPTFRNLLWSPHGSLVLAVGFGAGWLLLLLHECAHLATARAVGVPARMRLGTRLQFLVMQTDISGIELADRRHRLTAYLAGIAVNLAVGAGALLLLAPLDPGGTAHRVLAATVLLAVLPLPFQLMVFMRTDLYFVLQDLTGCRDLYGDGAAYARYVGRRVRRAVRKGRRGAGAPADPSRALPPRERRAVRLYSLVQVCGTVACLAVLATVTLPVDLALLHRAAVRLAGPGRSGTERLDGAVVLAVLGGAHLLWAWTWRRERRRRRAGGGRGAGGA
ncbi:hypothetical protein [Streptomyces sp. JJ36]|uniref:hypothetical protein n=1 Tax=Streptomyces sp. JJ36 TaxID=2736645 RepID=UPI0027E4CEAE|nr:hypothetical protein [Streptomyces sp. JJ36]MCF6526529.1 hypothetical protein [Streptomyces sp. JJ36]